MLKIFNKLRREINKLINKNYVKNKLKKRESYCKKCGQCCKGCKHLDKKTNLCKTYNHRPFYCHQDFPIDNLDQKVFKVKNCGYNFK